MDRAELDRAVTLTVDETAMTLGLSRTATYQAVQTGEIPAIRIGRRWLIPAAAIRQLLQIENPGCVSERVEPAV